MAKLKRTLYIGLGGTGYKTLVHTKKAFLETYGEVPPMIKFLAFDADRNQKEFTLQSICGEIKLDPSEQSSLQVAQSKSKVSRSRNLLSWLPERNLRAVEDLEGGCGMVRTNGRIAFSFNYQSSENAIQQALDEIRNLQHVRNDKYELLGNDVEVNLIFSIGGGTGSGTFLDMAYLVKNVFANRAIPETSKIIGYMVLPDVYDAQLTFGKDRLFPIGCASLVDLDYLSHLEFNESIAVNYITENKNLTGTPFNTIFAIGNTNSDGQVVTDIQTLSQMLSLAMVVSAGELSGGVASVANNLERDKDSGDYDIENKRAIMGSLGMSEITFRANDLKRLYVTKAAREVAAMLVNPGRDADTCANNWIDETKIRENLNQDQVIDYLLSKTPSVSLQEINDKANPKADVETYRQQRNVTVPNDVVDEKIEALKGVTNRSLTQKIEELVNSQGPAYALEFVAQVQYQIEDCVKEMREELSGFQNATNAKESAINTAAEEFKSACGKWINRQKAVADATETLTDAVSRAVINDREIQRRNGAITFYTWLLSELNSKTIKLNEIIANVKSACAIINKQISAINSELSSPSGLFQIDLTRPYVEKVTLAEGDVVFNQFVQYLPMDKRISDFGRLNPREIAELMLSYSSTISIQSDWENMTVEDALAQLDKSEAETVVRQAIKLSSPMCALDFRGYLNRELLNYYYVGVQEQSSTGLNGRILDLTNCIEGNSLYEVNFASIGSKDHIVIYHQYGVFPTFALGSTSSYRNRHDNYMSRPTSFSCHIDDDLRQRMVREGFSVLPKERTDNSLELWVKSLVFGLITRDEEGTYYYIDDTNESAALDNYKTSLGTKYRNDAFRLFQQQVGRIQDQYERIMIDRVKKEGQEAIDNLLEDARENYLAKYSLNRLTVHELNNDLYRNIREQLTNEVNYVNHHLIQ